jgi:hypothetical protein
VQAELSSVVTLVPSLAAQRVLPGHWTPAVQRRSVAQKAVRLNAAAPVDSHNPRRQRQ